MSINTQENKDDEDSSQSCPILERNIMDTRYTIETITKKHFLNMRGSNDGADLPQGLRSLCP